MYTNVGHKDRSGDVPVMLHNKGYLPSMISAWTRWCLGPRTQPPWAAHGVHAPFEGVTVKPPALPEVMTTNNR